MSDIGLILHDERHIAFFKARGRTKATLATLQIQGKIQSRVAAFESLYRHDNCLGFYGFRRPVFHSKLAFELSYNPAFMCHQNIVLLLLGALRVYSYCNEKKNA